MTPSPRPPLLSPAGCFLSNTAGAVFGMTAIAVGAVVGAEVGGERGAQIGLVVMGVLAYFTPWRRALLARVRKWQQRRAMRELGLTEGDDPLQSKN